MMRFYIIEIIFCQIAVQLQAEKFGNRFPHETRSNQHKHEEETLQFTESRFHSNREDSQRNFPNFDNRITRKSYDLPVTFKAPRYEAHDYWKPDLDYLNRRTFYEDFPRDKSTAFPSLYQFVTSIFGRETEAEFSEGYQNNRNTHKSVTPYGFIPTEPNYIPPPKPIRASVIKLETITRSPAYPPFDYETTTKYYPHVGTILNHVLIENAKLQQNGSWEPVEKIVPFKPLPPLPVLPKPGYPPATTLRPNYPEFFDNGTHVSLKYPSQTDYKYPESVQDQLPHSNLDDVKIPYVSEKPIPQIFIPPPTSPPKEFFPVPLAPDVIRSLNFPRRERPTEIAQFDTPTIKSFPGAVEKVRRPTFKFSKKLTAQLEKSPAERVANLTVLGFSKVNEDKGKELKQLQYINVRTMADTETNTLKNEGQNNSSARPVNLNDELSLDAKILKDTNWDGLTVPPETTTDEPKETTTIFHTVRGFELKTKPNVTAFWEIPEGQTTLSYTDATETTTDSEQNKIQTTTEFIWSSTTEAAETSNPTLVEETTSRKTPARRSETSGEESGKENLERSEVTVRPERMTFKRKYSRRPKIVSFTPYPTAEEIQKKLINRNHFPKRQKPNITLALGNKSVLKSRQSLGTEEVKKYSDEEGRRRKIGKRRQVYKRLRTSTSERPNKSDQL